MNKADAKNNQEYIDIDMIPESIANPTDINIKILDIHTSNCYTLYKHVPVEDIDILITNAHRLDEPWKKIEGIKPLSYYIHNKDIEEKMVLTNMINSVSKEQIDEIEENQKGFAKNIPNTVKYHKDYLWQIYYIERTKRYLMLVATEEYEHQAFVYLLTKKMNGNKGDIYVPICNCKYENPFISDTKISQLENKLYSLINYWPTIYQIVEKKDKSKLIIIGKINLYANIISDYKNEFKDAKSINEFCELIDKLFYIQTELSNYFVFDKFLDKDGYLHFYYDGIELKNDKLNEFYKKEIERKTKSLEEVDDIQTGLITKLKDLKKEEEKLNSELMYKQKQISTFLECKKTFFGKVKYYFKYKNNKKAFKPKVEEIQETKAEELHITTNTAYNNDLEDLIYICKQLKSKTILAATTRMDMQNIVTKIEILKKKIENANSYIKEIDLHKKSIFEFWKYTNKDEKAQLTQAENDNKTKKNNTEKVFDINNDLKFFAKNIDEIQRKIFNNNEFNSILLTKTDLIKDINNIIQDNKITSENFEKVLEDDEILDIYQCMVEHREKPRKIQNILNISKNSTFDEYKENLKKCTKVLEDALNKTSVDTNIPAYCLKTPKKTICTLELNPKKLIINQKDDINLYKININSNTHVIAFSNIIFFENRNKTLPIGMDYSTEILVDLREGNIVKTKSISNNIIDLNNNKVKKLNITEFNI